jgi:hypothetical protein
MRKLFWNSWLLLSIWKRFSINHFWLGIQRPSASFSSLILPSLISWQEVLLYNAPCCFVHLCVSPWCFSSLEYLNLSPSFELPKRFSHLHLISHLPGVFPDYSKFMAYLQILNCSTYCHSHLALVQVSPCAT